MRTVEDACPYGVGIVRYMRTVRDAGPYVRANTVAPLRIGKLGLFRINGRAMLAPTMIRERLCFVIGAPSLHTGDHRSLLRIDIGRDWAGKTPSTTSGPPPSRGRQGERNKPSPYGLVLLDIYGRPQVAPTVRCREALLLVSGEIVDKKSPPYFATCEV